MYPKWKKRHCCFWKQDYKNWGDPFKGLRYERSHIEKENAEHQNRQASAGSFSLGQTHPALASAKNGVVMSDEDVAQDPHIIIHWSKAGAAAVGWRLQDMTGVWNIW